MNKFANVLSTPSHGGATGSAGASLEASLKRGVVLLRSDNTFSVSVGGESIAAVPAASCLLSPEVGDRVLVAVDPGEEPFILAVLERGAASAGCIEVDHDLRIKSSGRLEILAGEELHLASKRRLFVATEALELGAKAVEVAVAGARVVGDELQSHFRRARAVSETFDRVADRVVRRIKRRYQFIEDSDQLRAGNYDLRAKELASLQAKHTSVTATEVVKVDGDQVHVG